MPIIVKLPDDSTVGEWAIVELQGDLESRDDSNIYGQFIGDLHYTKKDKPLLIIGHHILQGEVVTMEKPFAILERREIDNVENSDNSVEYVVKAIVKKKLVFSDRPKPIIANVPKVV